MLKLRVAFTPRAWGSLNEYLTVIDTEREFSTVICGLVDNILFNPFQFCGNSRPGCGLIWVSCLLAGGSEILLESSRNGQPLWIISQERARLFCIYTRGMWDPDLDDLARCISHRRLDDHKNTSRKALRGRHLSRAMNFVSDRGTTGLGTGSTSSSSSTSVISSGF